MSNYLTLGSSASNFTLKDTSGADWSVADQRGSVVVMLFYPGDETLVCTKQLCSVRDNWAKYMETNARIVGISPGTEREHYDFSMHHNLPMPLLADGDRSVTSAYGKHSWLPIWATRAVVVIDASGIVRHRKVMARVFRPTDDEVLAAIHIARYDHLAGRRISQAPA